MISLKSLPFLFKISIPRSITSLKRGNFTNLCAGYSFWSQPWNHLESYRHEKRLILTSMRLLLICGVALRYGYRICFPSKKISPSVSASLSILFATTHASFLSSSRVQMLYDLVTGAPIDINFHISQVIITSVGCLNPRSIILFLSLIIKLLIDEGVPIPHGESWTKIS